MTLLDEMLEQDLDRHFGPLCSCSDTEAPCGSCALRERIFSRLRDAEELETQIDAICHETLDCDGEDLGSLAATLRIRSELLEEDNEELSAELDSTLRSAAVAMFNGWCAGISYGWAKEIDGIGNMDLGEAAPLIAEWLRNRKRTGLPEFNPRYEDEESTHG